MQIFFLIFHTLTFLDIAREDFLEEKILQSYWRLANVSAWTWCNSDVSWPTGVNHYLFKITYVILNRSVFIMFMMFMMDEQLVCAW